MDKLSINSRLTGAGSNFLFGLKSQNRTKSHIFKSCKYSLSLRGHKNHNPYNLVNIHKNYNYMNFSTTQYVQ